MSHVDWVILGLTIGAFVLYGFFRGRGNRSVQGYLLADKQLKWGTIALSIMATQASAITFASTPGQAYVDGMRFVQVYFGLPIAMVILCVTAVPLYHRMSVFTPYEYLERRFDAKTRVLTAAIFLIQRGLAAGISIYAPSIILSVMLGIDARITSGIIGVSVILYATFGGVKAVNRVHVVQFLVVIAAMTLAFILAVGMLPRDLSVAEILHIAGRLGKLNTVDFSFDVTNRYNIWSGLIGGLFVALAYFGCDQSQVQRYLTGQTVAQSRLGLLFNGMVKVPMQFFILLLGVMVYVYFQFVTPPLFFNPVEASNLRIGHYGNAFSRLEQAHRLVGEQRSYAITKYIEARRGGNAATVAMYDHELGTLDQRDADLRRQTADLVRSDDPKADPSDTNYIFLSFVMSCLPIGAVGLVFACVFAASMSSSSGELTALASTTVVDVYRRYVHTTGSERHYLVVSRVAMAFWGSYAVVFAQFASKLGSLVEAVNILGSLFYGTLLAVFLLAFYVRFVSGTATFVAAFLGEAVVLYCFWFTNVSWLWYNVVGCTAVVGSAMAIQLLIGPRKGTDPKGLSLAA